MRKKSPEFKIAFKIKNCHVEKRQLFMFATLLFTMALTLRIIRKLAEQSREISFFLAINLFLFSVILHYTLIYLKKDRQIPLFHHHHHLKIAKYYGVVFGLVLLVFFLDYFWYHSWLSLSEILFKSFTRL